jgi:precorrin isomerase
LGCALTLAEVEEQQAITRRLTALRLLQPRLEANCEAVIGNAWKQEAAEAKHSL